MNEKRIETSHLTWKILRLTEKAITMLDSNRLDDALAVVDNRERAMNLLVNRGDINESDAAILGEVDKLNQRLLESFVETRDQLQRDIATTHKLGTAHRSYHSNQVK